MPINYRIYVYTFQQVTAKNPRRDWTLVIISNKILAKWNYWCFCFVKISTILTSVQSRRGFFAVTC